MVESVPKRLPAQQVAEACAAAMYERDYAAQMLDLVVEEIRPGYARLRMAVRKNMVNGHDICHGGMTFALADTAFAYCCNTHNQVTVASACTIDFVGQARLGDELTAIAQERSLSRRTGIYDITVSTQRGIIVAHFRGRAHRIKGQVVPGLEIAQ